MSDAASRIWVTWEKQRRNATLSEALGCRLYEFNLPYTGVVRYAAATALTLRAFVRHRPSIIFVQNPSIVLAALAVSYGSLFRIPVVVDTHNAGVEPFGGRSAWANRLVRFIRRRSAVTILSNEALAETVKSEAPDLHVAILPDPIPHLEAAATSPRLKGRTNVLFICSWAEDEPYVEVIRAATLVPDDTFIYMTGSSKGREKRFGDTLPANVVLTGYLSEQEYVGMLYACDVVIDLTTRENCLVCGAYEAVAAERGMILSGTSALRAHFRSGVIFTDNSAEDLALRIREAIVAKERLRREARALKQNLIAEWQNDREKLERMLEAVAS